MKTILATLYLCWICCFETFAKQETFDWKIAQSYTVEDGLPSNRIYAVTEDRKGFLWVATDNGLSRFDGKRFRNYTQLQGLPDNEVIQVTVDEDGIVWANTFPRGLVYFDTLQDRFVTPARINNLMLEDEVSCLRLSNGPQGGILYGGNSSKHQQVIYEFRKRKLCHTLPFESSNTSTLLTLFIRERFNSNQEKGKMFDIYNKGILVDSIYLNPVIEKKNLGGSILYDTSFSYLLYHGYLFKVHPGSTRSLDIDSIRLDSTITHISVICGHRLIFTSRNSIYLFDKRNLKLEQVIPFKGIINYAWLDSDQNMWVCSDGDGLILMKKRVYTKIESQSAICRNVCALSMTDAQQLVYGLVSGEVFTHTNAHDSRKVGTESNDAYVRIIMQAKKGICCITDRGIWMNWRKLNLYSPEKMTIKDGKIVTDSLLFICGLSKTPLLKINLNSGKKEVCLTPRIPRIDHLVALDDQTLYFSWSENLYRYSIQHNTYRKMNLHQPFGVRIQVLYVDQQNRVWVGLSNQKVIVLQQENLLANFDEHHNLTEMVTDVLQLDKHRFAFGTRNGLFLFREDSTQKKFTGTFTKFTTDDGLMSNQVNTLMALKDSLYVGTTDGISVLPISLKRSIPKLKTYLVSCEINGKAFPIQTTYNLATGKKQIQLSFMSPSLMGGLNYLEYSMDEGLHWQRVKEYAMNLLLDNGKYPIMIRSMNNDLVEGPILKLFFSIQIPFYETVWFWILMSVISTGMLFYLINRRKIQKQKIQYEKMKLLNEQRQKITADLHDDIGSSLSSLQINSAVAQRLMEKNKPEAMSAILKVEMQSKALSEKVSDFIWSLKPQQEEFMSLGTRIRSFASEILGAKEIPYNITIHEEVNARIQDPTQRKNIVLIVKEGINNIAKYSEATEVRIELMIHHNKLVLLLQDNGKGFQRSVVKGNGLQNMEKRATEIGATFQLHSTPGEGTAIRLSLNLTTNESATFH